MSIGPTRAFRDAFTSWAEHSFESADRLIQINVSTSTSTLNEIPVNASTKYPPTTIDRNIAQGQRDEQALGDRKDVIFVAPSNHEPKLSTLPPFRATEADESLAEVSLPYPKTEAISNRSSKSKGSVSLDESSSIPPADSSIYTLHSETSLYALPKLGAKAGKKTKSKSLSLPPDGEENPTVPHICCNTFPVKGFYSKEDTCAFFAKVFMVKVVQLSIIALWLVIVDFDLSLRNGIIRGRWYCLGICGSIFLLICTFLQCCAYKGPLSPFVSGSVLTVKTWSLALALGASMVHFRTPLLVFVTTNLLMSSGMLMTFFWKGNVDIKEEVRIIFSTPGAATVITSVMFFFVRKVNQMDLSGEEFLKLWLPFFIFSTLVLQVFMFELNTIIRGRRFPVSPEDWLYAATFL